ncbi:DUF2913 family protein [Vibrio owensii]|uniref:DUF2913 family protein n=1 Tax=Vibrio owensii TaxID=696485 RepID=UPI0018F17848|nr:DUF2913 family protein [Vibrio owensii]
MDYPNQIRDMASHALLHLEFYRLEAKPRRVTSEVSEQVLRKYLKVQLNRSKYKGIKKIIKGLTVKSPNKRSGTIEAKLNAHLSVPVPRHSSAFDLVLLAIEDIEVRTGVRVLTCPEEDLFGTKLQPSTQYISLITDNVERHFTRDRSELVGDLVFMYQLDKRAERELLGALNKLPQKVQICEDFYGAKGVRVLCGVYEH